MKSLHMNKMDTWLRHQIPWRKRVGGQERQRQLGDGWNKHRWESWDSILRMLKMNGSTWRVNTPVEKDWHDNLDYHEGLVFTSEYENTGSERYGINTWLRSNSNTTTKAKQNIGLQNKPEQTYDRDFVQSFCGGAYTGSIVQHHHVQGSAHDIRSVPESA